MTPTINVNLSQCECRIARAAAAARGPASDRHWGTCPAAPILIPCPIPRSVTFEVALECKEHGGRCQHAAPIRVTCSISGKTWEESEVTDILDPGITSADMFRACRDRWALVKALVLGGNHDPESHPYEARVLFNQRDAVFAALAVQARLEVEMLEAQQRTVAAIASPRLTTGETRPEDRPSAQALAVYVERLVEQISVLT